MVSRSVALAVSITFIAACGHSVAGPSSDPEPRRERNAYADTHEFLPLDPGRTWSLYNEAFPDRITKIRVAIDSDGAKCLVFDKNHADTYHGFINTRLVWRIHEEARGLYAGNELGTNDYGTEFGPYPDDQRYDIATGKWWASVWLLGNDPGAHILMPWSVRDGDQSTALQAYGYLNAQGASVITHQSWTVLWNVAGRFLRIRFNEHTMESNTDIFEDWTLERGVGIVQIEQWHDAGRTSILRRVAQRLSAAFTGPVTNPQGLLPHSIN